MRVVTFILAVAAAPAAAHELWLEPHAYQVPAEGSLQADIVNGENFDGIILPLLPQRIVNFVIFANDQAARVQGRPGDRPALNQPPLAPGLNIAAYQAQNATVDYETLGKFETFVDHKDLGDVIAVHRARSLPEEDFKEVYSRYSKTLFAVGDAVGADRRVGLETELVALTNPYTDDLSNGVQVQLYYRENLRADEQVEVFEKAPDGAVAITRYRTDDQGIATIQVKPGHEYMVDAVVVRIPNDALMDETGAVWETLWANLTFAVPE
ncbi:DUF4198 domain-containing protein [Yoonia sp.]|uniref:DUF4198 domain-containing protein n=1 Tax=Yoonia sp. TaxID=2212373 RepID=UPI0019F7E602|nr:DUF4198 domain-containing protein [Yoonia sp.]MBE0413418.1 DUF4198 domain-containing protein [Yoonia sp.]